MVSLSKRKGKKGTTYTLRWREGGKQHREPLGAVSAKEARIRRDAKSLELRTGKAVYSYAISFTQLADAYKAWHAVQYPDSHLRIRQIIDQHLVPDFRIDPINQISPAKVEHYKARRMKDVAPATVAKEIRTLKAMLNWAVKSDQIEANPVRNVMAPQIVESRPPHWYTMEQLAELYKGRHGSLWQFVANTGLRRGELKAFADKGDHIVIASSQEARTKSGKWREVPLNRNGRAALDALGGRIPLLGSSVNRAFQQDLPDGYGGSPHSLRHSFGTHHAIKGTPIRVLQKLMGHARIQTTEIYMHVAERHLQDAMEGFEL